MIRVAHAVRDLKIGYGTLYSLRDNGKAKFEKVGHNSYVSKADVEKYLATRAPKKAKPEKKKYKTKKIISVDLSQTAHVNAVPQNLGKNLLVAVMPVATFMGLINARN